MTRPPFGRQPDATDGLSADQRFALCDAANGLLGRFDHHWRRQANGHYHHAACDVATLVERGLIEIIADGIAQPTWRGRRVVGLIRKRRAAVEHWERIKCKN